MLLKFWRTRQDKQPPAKFNVDTIVLSPHHPVLEMSEIEAACGRSNNEVLHVQVTRENGDQAHIHFSVGINNGGQLFGEVTAMRGNEPVRRCSRVAKWRPPVNTEEQS